MSSKVSTVQVIDSRIEPQPEPTYATTIGPKQNQYYQIPASGLSDSYITFNNLTTLGANRAYLDTFELEITATVTLTKSTGGAATLVPGENLTFDSFPFNKCCDQIKVNINGGAFFSEPMHYLRAKERYWDSEKLNMSYGNICPCNKPWIACENPKCYHGTGVNSGVTAGVPSRINSMNVGYAFCAAGPNGSSNNDIINSTVITSPGTFTVTWREPIFCSPFSSRYDETYGRPLYNVTSIDLTFNMQNLGNMLRVSAQHISGYSVHIDSCRICYQVLTLPPEITPPPTTVVPYRRYVPYITDINDANFVFPTSATGSATLTAKSGVYTLNEVPTAIWVFLGPRKAALQQNQTDGWTDGQTTPTAIPTWAWNKLAYPLRHISISMANTTQILNTATPYDLYRIAKANGCQDSFTSWNRRFLPISSGGVIASATTVQLSPVSGVGSYLRLIPGTDIVLPEQNLIPGANANNAVFQIDEATFEIPGTVPPNFREFSLWLLFEYVGVARFSPGQCEITMNPLASGAVMDSAPVVSASDLQPLAAASTSNVEGSGWLDTIKNVWNFIKNKKLISRAGEAAQWLPWAPAKAIGVGLQKVGEWVGAGKKRGRYDADDMEGGAVMGMGDFI